MPNRDEAESRKRFTGRTLVAVNLDLPPEYIFTFLNSLRQFLPELRFDRSFRDLADETVIFPRLGVAILNLEPNRLRILVKRESVELGGVSVSREHLMYTPAPVSKVHFQIDDPLQLIGVSERHVGNVDVKVLVLDTGLETDHPDLETQRAAAVPFVKNDPDTTDRTGHGTHVTGLIGATATPRQEPRYSVASGVTLVTGRVTERETRSIDDETLGRALTWAMENDVTIVNMSFGTNVGFDEIYPEACENMFARALKAGILLVASAGNDPDDTVHPVEYPANCPSVMAVGAVDGSLKPASFSCGGINKDQNVDIAAPGVLIRSSFIGKTYKELSGTSMAAAYVSGAAALWAATPSKPRGVDLRDAVIGSARKLRFGSTIEIGAGLVQAPAPLKNQG
jgi:subtilisin family serine protease